MTRLESGWLFAAVRSVVTGRICRHIAVRPKPEPSSPVRYQTGHKRPSMTPEPPGFTGSGQQAISPALAPDGAGQLGSRRLDFLHEPEGHLRSVGVDDDDVTGTELP